MSSEVRLGIAGGKVFGAIAAYDVQGFYDAAANTKGAQQVDFFLAAPIDFITAKVAMRMNPDSAASVSYRASPGTLAVFY